MLLPVGTSRQRMFWYWGKRRNAWATLPLKVLYGSGTPPAQPPATATVLLQVDDSVFAPNARTLGSSMLGPTPRDCQWLVRRLPRWAVWERSSRRFLVSCG